VSSFDDVMENDLVSVVMLGVDVVGVVVACS
jgi:hypothetical protein